MIQYREAWRRFAKAIEAKPSWGKLELKNLMLAILLEEGED